VSARPAVSESEAAVSGAEPGGCEILFVGLVHLVAVELGAHMAEELVPNIPPPAPSASWRAAAVI
jgi:hypothetical protein